MTISLATAIARVTASKPVRLAVEAGLFCPGATYFDYGCGHGADIDYLQRLGFTSGGWDPHFRPDQPQLPADVVNIGYVINVIEDTAERRQALLKAWSLTQKVLIVAAQVLIDDLHGGAIAPPELQTLQPWLPSHRRDRPSDKACPDGLPGQRSQGLGFLPTLEPRGSRLDPEPPKDEGLGPLHNRWVMQLKLLSCLLVVLRPIHNHGVM